ncbi:MAG: hypothetical protein KDB27_21185 [Planctomycetales bacterium]|nr:hypothetical protein [Planctomycetales bacterium]
MHRATSGFTWDILLRQHFLGTVKAETEQKALEAAYFKFGQHLRGLIRAQLRPM